jgi:hypothetical protein
MFDALTVYFDGEKYAGLLLAGVSVALLAAAVVMFRARGDLRPFAITLGIVAVAQVALGAGLYLKTGPQVNGLVAQLRADPGRFRVAESERMARVQRNFVIVEYVEVAIIVVTAIAAVTQKPRPGIAGIALGLLIAASILLAFDVIAERRGSVYVNALSGLD